MTHFRAINRDTDFLLPPSMQEWLPEGHLARYVVEVVEGLDLGALERAYAGRGSLLYHPATLLSLLIYGYATGCFSSRKIERATHDSLAFRFIAANNHADHDTLATFRWWFAKEFEEVFVRVLQVARENQLSRFGTVSLDGTTIHANASRHSALSYGHVEIIEVQLQGEVQELLALAEEADGANLPEGLSLPEELKRRENCLAAIARAKATTEARAAAGGRKPGGKPATPGPRPGDQINFADEQSRIMPVAGGAFEQCYNAQAVVDSETMLVVAPRVTQAANDKQQFTPMLERLAALPQDLPKPKQLAADAGYFSEANVNACEMVGIEPSIAIKRDEHHPPLVGALHEPGCPAPGGHARRAHGPPAKHHHRPGDLRPAQTNR